MSEKKLTIFTYRGEENSKTFERSRFYQLASNMVEA